MTLPFLALLLPPLVAAAAALVLPPRASAARLLHAALGLVPLLAALRFAGLVLDGWTPTWGPTDLFRVDALIRQGTQSFVARFLDENEAMYPKEHLLLPRVLERMESTVSVYIGYAGALAPPDEGALQLLDPLRIKTLKLEL